MNEFIDFYTLIFFAVAVIVFMRLYSILGWRTGPKDRPYGLQVVKREDGVSVKNGGEVIDLLDYENVDPADRWTGYAQPGTPLAAVFDAMADIDPAFTPERFIEGAGTAYETVVTAFDKGDRETLKPLLAPDVYEEFSKVIGEREKRGEHIETTFIDIEEARILSGFVDGVIGQLTVRFVSNVIMVTSRTDEEIGTDDDISTNDIGPNDRETRKIVDVWSFSRDLSSSDPNWTLTATESA